MGLKQELEVFWAHVKALPFFGIIITYSALNRISPKLLDFVVTRIAKIINMEVAVKPSESVNFLGTTKLYKTMVSTYLDDLRKSTLDSKAAPNPRLYDLKANRWTDLLSYGGRSDKPLVVIFGSCT